MDYKGYTTFNNEKRDGVLYVTFEKGLEHDIENQRNWNDLVIGVQDIK